MWEKGNIAVLLSNDWRQVINKNAQKKPITNKSHKMLFIKLEVIRGWEIVLFCGLTLLFLLLYL